MNRPDWHPDLANLVGDFTSVSLLAMDLIENRSFEERVKAIQNQLWQDLEKNAFSGIEVMREMARQHGSQYASMPIVFTSALIGERGEQVQETVSSLKLDF